MMIFLFSMYYAINYTSREAIILCDSLQATPDLMFLIRIFTLSLSAWEMISNQNFKEPPMVAILSLCVSFFEYVLYP